MEKSREEDTKVKIKHNMEEIDSESETEEYNQIINEKKEDKSFINNSFLQKKRYNPEKYKNKKNPLEYRESNKFIDGRRNIKPENNRISEIRYSNDNNNLNNKLRKMKDDFEQRLRTLEEEQKNLKDDSNKFKGNSMNLFRHDFNKLKDDSEKLDNSLKKLEEKTDELQQFILKNNEEIESFRTRIEQEIDSIEKKVKELNEFYFPMKLSKLIKNLIQYLFNNYYPNYLFFNKKTRKINVFLGNGACC